MARRDAIPFHVMWSGAWWLARADSTRRGYPEKSQQQRYSGTCGSNLDERATPPFKQGPQESYVIIAADVLSMQQRGSGTRQHARWAATLPAFKKHESSLATQSRIAAFGDSFPPTRKTKQPTLFVAPLSNTHLTRCLCECG